MRDLSTLEERIGIKFKNPDLLRQSVVHRSYLNENPNFKLHHNERLEFLGDAVLEIVVTEYLYKHYPETPEGDLTNWRASLVNARMLAIVAGEIELENYLYLSRGEAKDKNSKARQYILANAVEALIGAIYLDQGIKKASFFVEKRILSKLEFIRASIFGYSSMASEIKAFSIFSAHFSGENSFIISFDFCPIFVEKFNCA